MIAYNIQNTKLVQRQKSPLEENVWLMPANCTDIEPPEFDSNTQTCSFNGTEWVVADIPIPEPEPEPEPYVPTYQDLRMEEYGSPSDQIEFITENGLEAWQQRVAEIKAKYPKPETP